MNTQAQMHYPKTMESGEVVNNFGELRVYVREKANKRTFHGIPKTESKLWNLAMALELQDSLNQGHKSEAHVKQHEQPANAQIITGEMRVQTTQMICVDHNAQLNTKEAIKGRGFAHGYSAEWYYSSAARQSRLDKAVHSTNDRMHAAGGGRLFSIMMRNTPFSKRLVNGKAKLKQIRPMRIMLERVSEKLYATYKAIGKKNTKGDTPKYRRVRNIRYRSIVNNAYKTQVVNPAM